jgi:hypothetical protein
VSAAIANETRDAKKGGAHLIADRPATLELAPALDLYVWGRECPAQVDFLRSRNAAERDLFKREIKSDLTPRQFVVLTVIAENEGCSQTDIVDATGIDRSTIAENDPTVENEGAS